jgi:hypothetical protein
MAQAHGQKIAVHSLLLLWMSRGESHGQYTVSISRERPTTV